MHGQEKDTERDGNKSLRSSDGSKSKSVVDEQSISSSDIAERSTGRLVADMENPKANNISSTGEDGCRVPENNSNHHSGVPGGGEQLVGTKVNEAKQDEKDMQAYEVNDLRGDALSDIHLNIRLPTGLGLQKKFSVTSTLKMVKDCVDENLPSGFGTYDLAIPYPRKVFSSQGKNVSASLLENKSAKIHSGPPK